MRKFWTDEEINDLKYYYNELGLSLSEFYIDFKIKHPNRTKTAVEVKLRKLKLKHTTVQLSNIKSRLNSGVNNGMYGKIGANNGLTKENCNRMRIAGEKISQTRKDMFKEGLLQGMSGEKNPMYGVDAWNKGETKYTDVRIREYGEKVSFAKKELWKTFTDEKKNEIIGRLSFAANKAKKDTKIEMIINQVLLDLDIKFIKNHRCSRYIFDFYLTDYNFVIECQGDYWHGNKMLFPILNETQSKNVERDKRKIKYLKDNNINSLFIWENEIYRFKEFLDVIIIECIKKGVMKL